jgi:hypothetical protein
MCVYNSLERGTSLTFILQYISTPCLQCESSWYTEGLPSHHLHFRLNSRDYVRDRGSPDNLDNSFSLSSIRVELQTEAFGSKSKPTDISVIVCRSTALVDAQNEFDPNMGNTCEVPKLVRWLHFLATRAMLILAEGHKYHF